MSLAETVAAITRRALDLRREPLELAEVIAIGKTQTGREAKVLHSFFRLADGSFLAFFEAPDMPFEFRAQHDFDLHIALEVDRPTLDAMFAKGKASPVETRGVSNHGFIDSIYFRDPNGYVIELTAKRPDHDAQVEAAARQAHGVLRDWQTAKTASA